jgi:hypothetical protein
MNFSIPTELENEQIILYALKVQNFDDLYAVAVYPKNLGTTS